jgi:hypothetical protein
MCVLANRVQKLKLPRKYGNTHPVILNPVLDEVK